MKGLLGFLLVLFRLRALPVANLYRFHAGAAALSRRAARLGLGPVEVREVEGSDFVREHRHSQTGAKVRTVYRAVFVNGPEVKLSGWAFVATLAHEDGAVVLCAAPGEKVPVEYRTADPSWCDHCKTKRARTETFLVRNTATGEYRRVGRDCLRDFVGDDSPENLAAQLRFLAELGEFGGDEESWGGGSESDAHDSETFLAYVSCAIDKDGWRSRATAREDGGTSTSDVAFKHAFEPASLNRGPYPTPRMEPSEANYETARKALEWARGWEDDGDYAHNLRVVAAKDWFRSERAGILASAVSAYRRETERFVPEARYLGEVGTKRWFVGKLVAKFGYETAYGWVDVLKFAVEGCSVVWKTSSATFKAEIGKTYYLHAGVKRQAVYRGEYQTEITRATDGTAEGMAQDLAKAAKKAARAAKKATNPAAPVAA